jgi:hypothetical protein
VPHHPLACLPRPRKLDQVVSEIPEMIQRHLGRLVVVGLERDGKLSQALTQGGECSGFSTPQQRYRFGREEHLRERESDAGAYRRVNQPMEATFTGGCDHREDGTGGRLSAHDAGPANRSSNEDCDQRCNHYRQVVTVPEGDQRQLAYPDPYEYARQQAKRIPTPLTALGIQPDHRCDRSEEGVRVPTHLQRQAPSNRRGRDTL